MRIVMKKGDFRFGKSQNGVVIVFRKSILDIERSGLKYEDQDVSTQWSCEILNGKIGMVHLEVCWDKFNEAVIIPFDVKEPEIRVICRQVATDKRINFANVDFLEEAVGGISKGLYAEVNRNQVLDWLDAEDSGAFMNIWFRNNPQST